MTGASRWSPRPSPISASTWISARYSRRPPRPRRKVDNDVHVVGVSSLAGAHLTLVPELEQGLIKRGRGDIMIIVGGVIPLQDYDELYAKGTAAIFGPGTIITNAADKILDDLLARSMPKVA
jgi:methylmalonyl-CoA mutase cobalamin-binding domain/chain